MNLQVAVHHRRRRYGLLCVSNWLGYTRLAVHNQVALGRGEGFGNGATLRRLWRRRGRD
jgi:hypothetical protein